MRTLSSLGILLCLFSVCATAQNPPMTAVEYQNRGLERQGANDLDGAIADYDKAIQLDPGLIEAYDNRANAKMAKGDREGAFADYTKAIQLSPLSFTSNYNCGVAHLNSGEN